MVKHISERLAGVIITIEDPIEFVFSNARSIIKQREVGNDTRSFAEALRHALRQDPDVILVEEPRDTETISATITAAETGHLVLGTLHTIDAPKAIDRIVDAFSPEQQSQIIAQLQCLRPFVSQGNPSRLRVAAASRNGSPGKIRGRAAASRAAREQHVRDRGREGWDAHIR
jgi:twitching motility protein PilT